MNTKLIPFFLFLFFVVSCKKVFKRNIVIDNPSSNEIQVRIGNYQTTIPPYGNEQYQVSVGKHEVLCVNDKGATLLDEMIAIDKEGILNPTQNTYVVWRDLYLNENIDYKDAADAALENKNTSIDNKVYQNVDFFVYDSVLFIPKTWDYDLNTDWPEKMEEMDKDYEVKSKVYRIKDLEETWGFYGNYDVRGLNPKELEIFIDSIDRYLDSLRIETTDSLETLKANQ